MRGQYINRIWKERKWFHDYYAQCTVHPLPHFHGNHLVWIRHSVEVETYYVLQHGSDGDRQTVVWRYLDNLDPVTSYTISQSREEQLEYLLVTAAEIGTFSRYVDIRTVSNLTIWQFLKNSWQKHLDMFDIT